MTKKLYENNALLKECQAIVTACTENAGIYLIELDQTVLFPEGGGQLSDIGKLNDIAVLHVSEKDGHIYHECAAALAVGTNVNVTLDWNVRLDRMQQHLGEHILSYACWKLFQANNVGFHMYEDNVTIDLDKELTDAELLQAELLTNEIIWDNRPVSISYMDAEEAVQLKEQMRKFNSNLKGLLRIVAVENADICTCCGTHPPFTGMVGSVKVIRHEKHKNGCRVEFLCGKRALLDADAKNATLLTTAAGLSVKPEQVPASVAKLKADMQAQLDAAKEKLFAVAEKELQAVYEGAPLTEAGYKFVVLPMEGFDAKDLKNMLSKAALLEKAVCLLLAITKERLSYAVVRGNDHDFDCRSLMKEVNAAFAGRGGGKPDCAQGGADYCEDWKEKLVQLAAGQEK